MRAGTPPLHAFARRPHRTERHPTAESLGERHHVRGNPELLRREPRAGAAHARLHLVEHEERADLGRELAEATDKGRGRSDVAALAKHRLYEDRGDVFW